MENSSTNGQKNKSRDFKLGNSFLAKCTQCSNSKMKIRSHRTNRWIFKDEFGKMWDAGKCNDCKTINTRIHSIKKYGYLPIDLVTQHSTFTGRQSERLAEKHFKSLGYSVSITTGTGPDLIITKNGMTKTVEVKTATKSSARSYVVSKVETKRKKDDLIAYVMNKQIIVRPMKEHLSECLKHGENYVTRFFVNENDKQNKRVSPSTGFKGVCKRRSGRYFAYIFIKCKQKSIGYFDTAKEAAVAYNAMARKIFGEYAFQNKV